MLEIVQNLKDPALAEAIEANFAEEMSCMARSIPGAELHKDAELVWLSIGPAGPNGVLHTSFSNEEPAHIDSRIATMINYYKAREANKMTWTLGPTATPSPETVIHHLTKYNFSHRAVMPGLVMPITHIPQEQPAHLTFTEVIDKDMLKIKCEVEKKGFMASDEATQNYYLTYAASGFGPSQPWHHYIAWLDGEAVAVAALLLHQGIAGIYGIATLPHLRRQGIGEAITRYTLYKATELGYTVAMLSSTEMSDALYRRIGFKEYCQLHHFGLTF